jgi:hypothetical protein
MSVIPSRWTGGGAFGKGIRILRPFRPNPALNFSGIPSKAYAVWCAISNHMASEEDLKAEIERLRAENEALKKPARGQMSLKVSEKGGLSVYGLGRFPVTLYREQWVKLLGMADEIRNFIRENDHALKKKE